MTFGHALAPSPGIPPIAIHHKADMAGQRSERKEVEQEGGREGVQAVQHRREDGMRRGHRWAHGEKSLLATSKEPSLSRTWKVKVFATFAGRHSHVPRVQLGFASSLPMRNISCLLLLHSFSQQPTPKA